MYASRSSVFQATDIQRRQPVLNELCDFGSQGCRFEPCRVQVVQFKLLNVKIKRELKGRQTNYLPKSCHFLGEPPLE